MGRVGLIDDIPAHQIHGAFFSDRLDVAETGRFKDKDVTRAGDLHEFKINVLVACRLCRLCVPARPQQRGVLGLGKVVGGDADAIYALGGFIPRLLSDLERDVISGVDNTAAGNVLFHGQGELAAGRGDIKGVDVPGVENLCVSGRDSSVHECERQCAQYGHRPRSTVRNDGQDAAPF